MSQRVNIQYSVPIEDLESEVERLTCRALKRLCSAGETADQVTGPILSPSVHEQIDSIRQELAAVDVSLAEVNQLITSYLAYKSGAHEQQTGASDDIPADPMPDISELQEKLARFKRVMGEDAEVGHDNTDQG